MQISSVLFSHIHFNTIDLIKLMKTEINKMLPSNCCLIQSSLKFPHLLPILVSSVALEDAVR